VCRETGQREVLSEQRRSGLEHPGAKAKFSGTESWRDGCWGRWDEAPWQRAVCSNRSCLAGGADTGAASGGWRAEGRGQRAGEVGAAETWPWPWPWPWAWREKHGPRVWCSTRDLGHVVDLTDRRRRRRRHDGWFAGGPLGVAHDLVFIWYASTLELRRVLARASATKCMQPSRAPTAISQPPAASRHQSSTHNQRPPASSLPRPDSDHTRLVVPVTLKPPTQPSRCTRLLPRFGLHACMPAVPVRLLRPCPAPDARRRTYLYLDLAPPVPVCSSARPALSASPSSCSPPAYGSPPIRSPACILDPFCRPCT
jgi:hypothetical protein